MPKKRKIKVGILFGGKSAEHEISLHSAENVIAALDREKYHPVPIKIDKQGKWFLADGSHFSLNPGDPENKKALDVVFPILHGTYGEDGTIQGLLKLADIPFVGAGVLGSAVGMDKDIMKRLLRDANIPIAEFLVFGDSDKVNFAAITQKIGLPFFVKPANLGSSVGINKVKNKKDFVKAIAEAFQYDRKIIVEEFIKGREIECAVLGNDNPIVSIPGEIIVNDEFYSYEAKYINENGAILEIPAKLDKDTQKKIQNLAVQTFKTLACEGMGRVDFFLRENGAVIVNEINTIPGFTSISMYPKLWEASGTSYAKLIDRLIQLALERFAKEQKIKTACDI